MFNFLWFGVMIDIWNYFTKLPLTFDFVWDSSKPIVCPCLLPPANSWQSWPTHRPHQHRCPLAVLDVLCWVDPLSNLIPAGLPFYKTLHTYYSLSFYCELSPEKAILPTTHLGTFTFMWVINISLNISKDYCHADIQTSSWSVSMSWQSCYSSFLELYLDAFALRKYILYDSVLLHLLKLVL